MYYQKQSKNYLYKVKGEKIRVLSCGDSKQHWIKLKKKAKHEILSHFMNHGPPAPVLPDVGVGCSAGGWSSPSEISYLQRKHAIWNH
jgi:hypothetical protein